MINTSAGKTWTTQQVKPIRAGCVQIWLFILPKYSQLQSAGCPPNNRGMGCWGGCVYRGSNPSWCFVPYGPSFFSLLLPFLIADDVMEDIRVWHSHRVWNQCKPCHSLQWIQAHTLEVLPQEKPSLGRGSGKVTSVCPGPGGDRSHFVDGFRSPKQEHKSLPAAGTVSGCGWPSSRDHRHTSLTATEQLRKCSSFSVLSPTAELIEESERLKIISKSLTLLGHIFFLNRCS